jgi:hypothetical protein
MTIAARARRGRRPLPRRNRATGWRSDTGNGRRATISEPAAALHDAAGFGAINPE